MSHRSFSANACKEMQHEWIGISTKLGHDERYALSHKAG